jgi:hypothetical protein
LIEKKKEKSAARTLNQTMNSRRFVNVPYWAPLLGTALMLSSGGVVGPLERREPGDVSGAGRVRAGAAVLRRIQIQLNRTT